MTTDLEKQFFDTFGIEPKRGVELTIDPTTDDNVMNEHKVCYGYPQINDRILLELICIVNKRRMLPSCDVNGLKKYVLDELSTMIMPETTKQQVQALFKE